MGQIAYETMLGEDQIPPLSMKVRRGRPLNAMASSLTPTWRASGHRLEGKAAMFTELGAAECIT